MAPSTRTMARQSIATTPARSFVRTILAATLVVVLIAGLGWLSQQSPRQIECTTSENTYCRDDLLQTLADLRQTRFFFAGTALRSKEKYLLSTFPDLLSVQIRRTLGGTLQITVTFAQPIMTVVLNGTPQTLRENGYLTPTELAEGQLIVELTASTSGQQLLPPWGSVEQKNLAALAQGLQHFRPRIKKIKTSDPILVMAYPEEYGPISLRADRESDPNVQLSTLQAFFHSTTMEKPYQAIDVRFAEVVVKE